MHDGAVVFDTKLNNKQLEKDYAKAVKKVEQMESDLNDKKDKKNALSIQLEEVTKKADEARNHIKMLKDELSAIDAAMKPGSTPDDFLEAQQRKPIIETAIQEAETQLAPLVKESDKLSLKLEKCKKEVTEATAKLEKQKYAAARVSSKIEEAAESEAELAKTTDNTSTRFEKLGKRFAQLAASALVFSVATKGLTMLRHWLGEVIKKDNEATAAIARLKGALLTMAQPLLEVVIPAFTVLVNLLTAIIGKIASFLSMLGGKSVQQSASAAKALNKQADAYENVAESAEEAAGQLAGFDEINRLDNPNSNDFGIIGSTDAGANGDGIVPDFSWAEGVSETMDKIAGYVLAIAAGLALWKISTYFSGPLAAVLGMIGKLVAGVGLVALGITLLVEAFDDATASGWNLQNTLLAVAGIVATGLGLSILTGSWIPLLIAGIASVLLAITTLTGNGGELIEGFKALLHGFSEFLIGVFTQDAERAGEGLKHVFRGVFNVVASIINSLLKLIAEGLNFIQVDIPEWVPIIGGRHFGFNIQRVPQIPYLAQGAVIPPNREFLAVLGDQTSGTNIEAPLETIKQALAEVMGEYGGGDITINFTGDLAQLARILKPQIDRENRRVGTALNGGETIWDL